VDFTIPTGNFGNILAGYYSLRMGLPIRRLICASNENNVLYDFFRTGIYDTNRTFHTTITPSMDILISSNLERLLYHALGDPEHICTLMKELVSVGCFKFTYLPKEIYAAYATEEETRAAIRAAYGYDMVIDPHTAVGYHAYKQVAHEVEVVPNVILATASPYKFAGDVYAAIKERVYACEGTSKETESGESESDEYKTIKSLAALSQTPPPSALTELFKKPVLHNTVCDTSEMIYIFKKTLTSLL
jgi:threonine synthase